MSKMRIPLITILVLLSSVPAVGKVVSDTDTLSLERKNNRNVLLNASSGSQPRIISLGIPQFGTPIMEDGLPVSMYSDFFPAFWYWRSGLAAESTDLTRLDESAIQTGVAGFFPKSTSKVGSSSFEGEVDYSISHFGRQELDLNLAFPLGKGWSMDLNLYQDMNRGNNHIDLAYLQEHIQYYKAAISKDFTSGRLFATYLYTKRFSVLDPCGPFIFVGDGSVSQYEDFKLGKDQYLPSTPVFDYIDVVEGVKRSRRFVEDGGIPTHILTAGYSHTFDSGISFELSSRLKLSHCDLTETMLGSIENATADGPYNYITGEPFAGKLQTRFMFYHQDDCNDWMTTMVLRGRKGSSSFSLGANAWIDWTINHMMTTNFAHEAKKDPQALLYGGDLFYIPNAGAQFMEGSQSKFAIFGQDEWNPSGKLTLRAGLRLEYSGLRGDSAFSQEGKEGNIRGDGWSLKNPGAGRTPFRENQLNGAASLVTLYRISEKWTLELDAIATQQHAELWQYGEAEPPTDLPKRNVLVRGGVNFKNSWVDFQTLLMFYGQYNNYYPALWTHELDKPAGGYPAGYKESVYVGSKYSMTVPAWTTDVVLTPFEGFSFHGFMTLRLPRYSNYIFQPTFSDGFSETFDFSGKFITGSPNTEIELEPSYQKDKWRLWTSVRYYGKYFVNITNNLFFNPHWETFAGVDYSMNERITLKVNLVNFLNQKGASAGLQEASLSTDPTPFKNYLTSGSYLRPFALEAGVQIRL